MGKGFQLSLSTLLILTLTIAALIGLNCPREYKVVNAGVMPGEDFWRVEVSDQNPLKGTISDHTRDDVSFTSDTLRSVGWPFRIHSEWKLKSDERRSCVDGPTPYLLTPELTRVFRTLETETIYVPRDLRIYQRIDFQTLATQRPEFLEFIHPVVDNDRELVTHASLSIWAANIFVGLLLCMVAWALCTWIGRLTAQQIKTGSARAQSR